MRVSIIPADNFVSVDGEGYFNVSLDNIPSAVNAIQWYGDFGGVEIKDDLTGRIIENVELTSFLEYEWTITAWENAKTAFLAEQQRLADERAAFLAEQQRLEDEKAATIADTEEASPAT